MSDIVKRKMVGCHIASATLLYFSTFRQDVFEWSSETICLGWERQFLEIFPFLPAFTLFCYCVLKFFPRKAGSYKVRTIEFLVSGWTGVVNEAKWKQERPDRKRNAQSVLMWECGYVSYLPYSSTRCCGASSVSTNLRLQFNRCDVQCATSNARIRAHILEYFESDTFLLQLTAFWQCGKENLIWLSTHSLRHNFDGALPEVGTVCQDWYNVVKSP